MELYKLWKEVEKKYQMRLEAGEKGLSRETDWVHIIESQQPLLLSLHSGGQHQLPSP